MGIDIDNTSVMAFPVTKDGRNTIIGFVVTGDTKEQESVMRSDDMQELVMSYGVSPINDDEYMLGRMDDVTDVDALVNSVRERLIAHGFGCGEVDDKSREEWIESVWGTTPEQEYVDHE